TTSPTADLGSDWWGILFTEAKNRYFVSWIVNGVARFPDVSFAAAVIVCRPLAAFRAFHLYEMDVPLVVATTAPSIDSVKEAMPTLSVALAVMVAMPRTAAPLFVL